MRRKGRACKAIRRPAPAGEQWWRFRAGPHFAECLLSELDQKTECAELERTFLQRSAGRVRELGQGRSVGQPMVGIGSTPGRR